jgi:FkbM family methyltransferase
MKSGGGGTIRLVAGAALSFLLGRYSMEGPVVVVERKGGCAAAAPSPPPHALRTTADYPALPLDFDSSGPFSSIRGITAVYPAQYHVAVNIYSFPSVPPFTFVTPNGLDHGAPLHDPHVAYTLHHILKGPCALRGRALRTFDVGAGHGHFTGQMAALGCSVVAVEARPNANENVNLTKLANGWTDSDVFVYERLVSDADSIATASNSAPTGFQFNQFADRFVVATTLAKMNDVPGVGVRPCHAMKIDIEGHEVRGLLAAVKSGFLCENYVVEVSPKLWGGTGTTNEDFGELVTLMDAQGFGFRHVNWELADSMWKYPNPSSTGWFDELPEALWVDIDANDVVQYVVTVDRPWSEFWIYRK